MELYYSPGASLASHIAWRETGLLFEMDRHIAATGTEIRETFSPSAKAPRVAW